MPISRDAIAIVPVPERQQRSPQGSTVLSTPRPLTDCPLEPIARFANWRQMPATQAHLTATRLGPGERQRLAAHRDADSRQRFLAARALARSLLDECAGEHCWELSAEGPPRVLACPDWPLSLSHSGDWVGAALGGGAIGIDLESSSRQRRFLAIAQHYFHPQEEQQLRQVEGAQRQRRFLLQWTAREAYLKALGQGIAGGLQRLCIHCDERDQVRVQLCDGARGWHFAYWVEEAAVTACVAWRHGELKLERWDWRTPPQSLQPAHAPCITT